MRRLFFAALPVGILIGAVLAAQPKAIESHYVAGSQPDYSVDDLTREAEAIVVLKATDKVKEHWNNTSNTKWAPEEIGIRSHIYRDQAVEIVDVVRGKLASERVVLRTAGGEVDGVNVAYEEWPKLQPNRSYVAFLRQEATPTQTGQEVMWTLVWGGHGLFTGKGDAWTNEADKVLSLSDLE